MRRSLSLFVLMFAGVAVAQPWQPLAEATPPAGISTPDTAAVELGRLLFHDPRLSPSNHACATCHDLGRGGDGGEGAPETRRSILTLWNTIYFPVWFWDGRAGSLAEVIGATGHEIDPQGISTIPGYREHFAAAFGSGAVIDDDAVSRALVAFVSTLTTPVTPYDRFVQGDDQALGELQKAGMDTFQSLGCRGCHMGPVFNGPPMPAGTGFYARFPTFMDSPYVDEYGLADDPGRLGVTGAENDRHMWRVPTLRNVALTSPYFHNGSVATLEEAVRVMASVQLNRELSDEQVRKLVAFLESLSADLPDDAEPALP